MKFSTLSTPTRAVVLTALYFIGGLLGKASAFMSGEFSLVWPPAGIAVAAVLLFGYGIWPGVAAGAILFTFVKGTPFTFFTAATAIGNTVGAIICAFLLERFVQFKNPMEKVRHVVGFIIFACLLGTTVNAVFNSVGLCYSGQVSWNDLFANTVKWWVPNALGVLVVAPLILVWDSPTALEWPLSRMIEAGCCAIGLFLGTQLSFNSWYVSGVENYPLAYLPYPFLVWGALRFGQRGATTGTLVISGLAIRQLLFRQGPFWTGNDLNSLTLVGCYIGIVAISNMLLAAASVEREKAIRATFQSEKRYRAVVEDQTDLICRFTPDGTLTFVNDAYCRFHQGTREQLVGTNFFPMLNEQDREIPLQQFGSLTPAEPPLSFDDKVMLPTGKFIWQQCTVRALFDEAGRIVEFQTVIQDITRRKQSEEALRLGEERLRGILNSMVDGVVALDEAGMITLLNPTAEKIFHRNTAEVLGMQFRGLLAFADQARYDDYLAHHLREAETKIIEASVSQPNGALLPIDLAVSEIFLGGVLMLIVVVRDISERKKLEDQFRQAQKMEAIGRLAGGIAHDFNNLMQAILGYSNLLDRRLTPDDPNRDTVQQIQKSLSHATSLTGQLLAFSRKQVLKTKLLSLNSVVSDMSKLLQRVIGETIQLQIQLATPVPWVRADAGQLEQLIMNLAINARDAMPDGGILRIEASHLEVTERQVLSTGALEPGAYALLRITDSGCGMPAEVQAHLFEPFFTTKELGKGTGLGLSIVYGVVKQSGGEVTIESEVGRGTTFNIYLPRVDGAVRDEESTTITSTRSGGCETILLVEDEALVRMMLTEVLKSEGYIVLDASNGLEGLEVAEQFKGKIDLLVTDMTMPGLSGSELASRLMAKRRSLPALFISGYTDEEASEWETLGQPVQFLQKPFHPDAFLTKTRQILDKAKGGHETTTQSLL